MNKDKVENGAKRRGAGGREKTLLEKLSQGLSEREIRRVLDGALAAMDKPALERLVTKLGPETGAALRGILLPSGKTAAPRRSSDKLRQEWDQAWAAWNAVILDASDESGQYVIQDHHWEQPYFDPLAVTDDLEPIAAKMGKLLSRIFDDGSDPDFSFAEAVKGSIEEISAGLPEWMNPFESEEFGLGPRATGCLLDWEWRAARRVGTTAFPFLDMIRELESSTVGLNLDGESLARFVRALDANSRKEIQRGIRSNRRKKHWSKVLDSAWSPWFGIYKDLCREHEPSVYLENCLSNIHQDWTLALPVIQELSRASTRLSRASTRFFPRRRRDDDSIGGIGHGGIR